MTTQNAVRSDYTVCPDDVSKASNAFYLRPLERPENHVWYYNQTAGKNALSAIAEN